ncbi:MAG: AIR synthase-related protein, partial [Syntrophales bacterium LBB04]|nr:AIR synthase-related protein [Syntrophales bacterium LBB04]
LNSVLVFEIIIFILNFGDLILMDSIIAILEKIEAPLLFSSKDSYRHLPLIKGLEATMRSFLMELKSVSFTNATQNETYTVYKSIISGFEEAIAGFDGLSLEDKKERIEKAMLVVKKLRGFVAESSSRGIVHITGGGFIDNIPRILPKTCRAVILSNSWDIPPVFTIIKKMGNIDDAEMYRVFNMGIGMMVVATEKEASEVTGRLENLGMRSYAIGFIDRKDEDQPSVSFI